MYFIFFVFLCFIKPILGNHYGPGVSLCQQTSDNNLGVARSSSSTLTTLLAILIPSFFKYDIFIFLI